jgi:hypothetical protein
MIIVHAVQKLLNISRLKPALYISEPADKQELHSWYAKLVSTSFIGKLMVMYVHEPSLIVVLTKGKTIAGTIEEFYLRLELLLRRNNFEPSFIEREMQFVKEGYVISKTNSKSILASMNVITQNIEYRCSTFPTCESINLNEMEDSFMEWMTYDSSKPDRYRCTSDYWKEKGFIK